jgi:hypothetical protein
MKIELWLEDVALECTDALEKGSISLPPLVGDNDVHSHYHCADMTLLINKAHHVLLNLSSRASMDDGSLRHELEIYISVNICISILCITLNLYDAVIFKSHNCIKAFGSIIQYLCQLRLSQSGADGQYTPGFKLLATMMKARHGGLPV